MNIELTKAAADEIRKVIVNQELDPEATHLRVDAQGYGPQRKYTLDLTDRPREDDERLESQGIAILCPRKHVSSLNGATIDFREQESVGWGFAFDLPADRQVRRSSGEVTGEAPEKQEILEALHLVNDPEVGVNVVDLGLIYGLAVEGRDVKITMTMTTPACPMSGMIRQEVDERIRERCPGVDAVEVEVVWDPPWSPESMTAEGKRQLGWSR